MAKKTLRYADATTRKLCSAQHVYDTTHPNKLITAINTIVELMGAQYEPETRLRAADKILNHSKGTPSQTVDLTSNGKDVNVSPTFITSNPALQEKIKKLYSEG